MTIFPSGPKLRFGITCLAIALVLVPCAWPQTTVGAVSGTVRDQSGAVIPNASVVLTNTATNVSNNTKTNEAGFYIFPAVENGHYGLAVEFAGMEKYEGTFNVAVAERVVINPVLRAGQVTTSVQVGDVTPLVATDNPTVSSTLENQRINQLPINGRDIRNLLATIPEMESFRVFGTTGDSIEWVLNGAVITDRRWCCGPATDALLDSLQEFTVESNAVSAKMAHPVSLLMVTKNGTNTLHGTAFDTLRNNDIGLARARTDYYTSPPPLNRNEFGVNAGGPVYIPKLYNGKNKTFWFFDYEGNKTASAVTNSYEVPTVAMRNGDFSGQTDANGRLYTVYNPYSTGADWSRQPYPGNIIPASLESPLAKYMFSITPLPTSNANPLVDVNWFGPVPTHYSQYQTNTRIDHQFSDRDHLFGVVTEGKQSNLYPNTSGAISQPALNNIAGLELDKNTMMTMSLTWTHTISPSFFSNMVLSGKRNILADGENMPGQTDWADKLGLPNPFNSRGWAQVTGTGLGNYQIETNSTEKNHENYIVLNEDLTKVHGKHEFQFGGSYRLDLMNILPQQFWPAPQVSFAVSATELYDPTSTPSNPLPLPYTGADIANMYLGLGSYANTLGHQWYYLHQNESALYFQDNLKATTHLTLNLGMRWEHLSPYHDIRDGVTGFSRETMPLC